MLFVLFIISSSASLSLDIGTHLFVKVPPPGDSEMTFSVFELSECCYYQSNNLKPKVEVIPFSALPKDTSKLADLSPH